MEKYHILDLIGEGSFGRVYKGRKKFSGQVVAMKFIPKVGRSEKELRNLRREIEIMRELHHPNIIEMLDSFETDKEVVAVTDYAEGELFQILEDDGNLPEEQVQSIACQLVSALYYLHSHRILHRDMKPQNILLGKGGVVKLCDFGFARAMSINTLVLTSIKGTPLYMSPELVEEKPYDHTADLWALGCILYELFTGQPPFYTNSIFQLVSLIIKDPVRWPKNMSPPFKEFLQGLLTKNPRNRLSWPMLLEHPFVAHGVTVNEKDKLLASPFTRAPTASLIIERDKQAKEKTQPAGTSKILSKAREKADKENKKKQAEKQASRIEAWGKEPGEKQPLPVHPDRPHTRQWEHAGASQVAPPIQEEVQPTPRPDRISQDYANEYPSIEVESRTVLNKPEKKNIENVKLNEEEADSDDEWQGLVETSDPETDPDMALTLMKDAAFVAKLKSRLQSSSVQVLDGILEGASRLRPVLRVITNMFAYKGEEGAVGQFASSVDCPGHLLTLIQEMLQKNTVKQQPWCQQILLDLVATISAFTASDILSAKDPSGQQVYVDTCVKFGSMMEKLLNQKFDKDLRLREQTLMCMIFLCETMEKMALSVPDRVFSGISQHRESIEAVLHGCLLDEELLKQMEEVAEGNSEAAQQRIEDLVCLSVACLAALTHLPVQEIHGTDGKRQIATVLGGVLSDAKQQSVTEDYLLLINHPSTCANVLKALYSSCQECISLCRYLGDSHRHMVAILGVLQGKVELADMECNSVMEMVLQLLNTIIVQTKQIPQDVADISPFIVGIFLESQLASHTAAAALLFSQMLYLGVTVDVPHEELMNAALSEFTDLAQICVRCPLDFGVLDGIVLLLYQVVAQGDVPIASMYIECGIWNMLWHRLAQMLKVRNLVATGDLPQIIDMETDGEETQNISMPDWNMLSFQGLLGVLQLAVAVFTKETFQVMSSLANSDGILTLTLMHLMSRDFLDIISNRSEFDKQKHTINTTLVPCFEMKPDGGDPAIEVTMQVTQLCCFPFAIDANEDLLATIQESFYRSELLPRLLWASQSYLRPEQLELPVGLMSRLVLSDGEFVLQFAGAVKQNKAHGFLRTAMRSDQPSMSVLCDTISVCSHLARTTPDHLILLMDIFKGDKNEYKLLETLLNHDNAVVRSRICSLLGNCMKHSNIFYAVLHQRAPVMQGLIAKLRDEDANVKKGASYAIGNAGYHSSELYSKLKPAIPFLIKLLDDPIAKTRANAASALGNMALHSADLATALIQEKAIQSVLEVACHDSQYGVQECALTALRSMVNQDKLKQELKRLKALEKLTNMTDPSHTTTPRPRSSLMTSKSLGRRSITTVMQHCAKLVRLLGN